MKARVVLWIAWIVFMVSLFCPAVVVDLGDLKNSEYSPGYFCAAIFWPYYLSNLALLFAPLILWAIGKHKRNWPRITLSVFYLISGIGALCLLPLFTAIHIGYVLWVVSYFLASYAAWSWSRAATLAAELDAS